MSAKFIYECEWPGVILGWCVDFELRAPQEVAVQQSTARGARGGRRGQLVALVHLARHFSVDRRASNSEQRIANPNLRT